MKPQRVPTFTILKKSRSSRARLGVLQTPHGTVHTPTYVIVATHGHVRTLSPADIRKSKTQIVIANTYHLWGHRNVHRTLGTPIPMMTDSGGFQVFSFGAAREQGVGKVLRRPVYTTGGINHVRITERGVHFLVGKTKRFLSPETSIKTQEALGADIIFAFDECTSPLHPQEHTLRSMDRTHRWALRCLNVHKKKNQMLFGIVQGGRFKKLRTLSARTIGAMNFDGFGIGGSYGKNEMRATLEAVVPHLPEDKPRHLLGIGTVADIFDAIEAGVDTFDCVIPTREARHGRVYTNDGAVDIRKRKYDGDKRPLLASRATFGQLHRFFRLRDVRAGRLATLHNVRWFNRLLERIRAALSSGSYAQCKKQFLTPYAR